MASTMMEYDVRCLVATRIIKGGTMVGKQDEGWPSDRQWRWRWCTPPLVLVHFTNRSSPAAC